MTKDYIGYESILAPKITIKFLGNIWNNFEVSNAQYLLKYDIFTNMYMIQIYDVKNL